MVPNKLMFIIGSNRHQHKGGRETGSRCVRRGEWEWREGVGQVCNALLPAPQAGSHVYALPVPQTGSFACGSCKDVMVARGGPCSPQGEQKQQARGLPVPQTGSP